MFEQKIKLRRKMSHSRSKDASSIFYNPGFVISLQNKPATELLELAVSFNAYINKV